MSSSQSQTAALLLQTILSFSALLYLHTSGYKHIQETLLCLNVMLVTVSLTLSGKELKVVLKDAALIYGALILLGGQVTSYASLILAVYVATSKSLEWSCTGAWLMSFILLMDWERPYQKYPLPNIFGAAVAQLVHVAYEQLLTKNKLK